MREGPVTTPEDLERLRDEIWLPIISGTPVERQRAALGLSARLFEAWAAYMRVLTRRP